jgi:hypothetical protein
LFALRKAAEGVDVVGRHRPVGEIHRCPALTVYPPDDAQPRRWHDRGPFRALP